MTSPTSSPCLQPLLARLWPHWAPGSSSDTTKHTPTSGLLYLLSSLSGTFFLSQCPHGSHTDFLQGSAQMSRISERYPGNCLKRQVFTLYPLYLDSETFTPCTSLNSMHQHQTYLFLCLLSVSLSPSPTPLDCIVHEGRDFF